LRLFVRSFRQEIKLLKGDILMKSKPEQNMRKCGQTLTAVAEIAPSVVFGGMKAADYEIKVEAMRDARHVILDLEIQLSAARDHRDLVDIEGLAAEALVINGIVGDVDYGPDSPLYGATGRKRKSERKSGLTRRKKKTE
jgi:hypothetical protein